jgi:hypothetical protein
VIAAARHDAGVAGAVATPSTDGTRAAVPAALPSARPDRPVDVADVSAAAPSEAVSEAAVHG